MVEKIVRLTGYDVAPTPFYGKLNLVLVCLIFLGIAETGYWWYLRQRGRLEEYWRLIAYPPDWLLWLDRYLAVVVFPEQEQYVIDL